MPRPRRDAAETILNAFLDLDSGEQEMLLKFLNAHYRRQQQNVPADDKPRKPRTRGAMPAPPIDGRD